ncbi:Abi-alpha family protein [Acidovorax sp. SUPP2539]|uniref:Abi-alpha family protein n=1 Tax=Acidovorax sp. SUPP2539 TaxID=2920878 RepID=UPI0023DE4BF6|nr:Abi-alpha family protein [Acidovorax sp. SUPP2539]GKS88295.1 Abi-alpha family protein [Acidovorax sp. SUPP2539]
MDEKSFEESAKAVQEVAKTANTLLESAQKTGSYIGKHLEGVLEQWLGKHVDNLKAERTLNRLRLNKKLEEEFNARKLPHTAIEKLPLNFVGEAVTQASLQTDDSLLDLWVQLMVNSIDSVEPRVSFVSILKEMTPLDARIFKSIYSISGPDGKFLQIYTKGLPDVVVSTSEEKEREFMLPSENVVESLAILERLGVVAFGTSWAGAEAFDRANQTTLGKRLYNAISSADERAIGQPGIG